MYSTLLFPLLSFVHFASLHSSLLQSRAHINHFSQTAIKYINLNNLYDFFLLFVFWKCVRKNEKTEVEGTALKDRTNKRCAKKSTHKKGDLLRFFFAINSAHKKMFTVAHSFGGNLQVYYMVDFSMQVSTNTQAGLLKLNCWLGWKYFNSHNIKW